GFVAPAFLVLRAQGPAGPFRATPAAGLGDGVGPLSGTALGVTHTFVWDSTRDIPAAPTIGAQEVVILVLVPGDAAAPDPETGVGPVAQSAPFKVDNTIAPSVSLVSVRSPTGVQLADPPP